ncbi:MAG: CinA family nicotinamide mononucleotide deamidase-related protein [Pirellulaceae bacterium]
MTRFQGAAERTSCDGELAPSGDEVLGMNAEVIAIGDELTSGQRLDTNSQWLSERLGELGIRVLYHTTVGDELEANVRVFRQAFDRADLIVCTGGLGPTADDLTREAIAAALGRALVQNDDALKHIQAIFARRSRAMPERNLVQALFPENSRMVPNPHGTAPGIDVEVLRVDRPPCRLFALPGVPAEMREMWEETVAPAISVIQGGERRVIRHRRIKCFGVGESDLEQMLPDLIRRGRYPTVGITVSQATITLRITAEGSTAEEAFAAMDETWQTIHDCLGDLVFGYEDDELQHAVARQLGERNQTLSTIEWGTGGLLAHWISSVDPEQRCYRGGTILRGVDADEVWTRQNQSAIASEDDSSEQPAAITAARAERSVRRMASASRNLLQTDYALAVGPLPSLAESSEEPGRVACAVASAGGVSFATYPYAGHPDILLQRTAKSALNLLRKTIAGS